MQLDLFSWKINRFEKYFYLLQNLEIDFHAIFASQNYLEIRKIACILKSRKKKRKISSTIITSDSFFRSSKSNQECNNISLKNEISRSIIHLDQSWSSIERGEWTRGIGMAAKEKTGELEIIRKLPCTSRGTSGRRRASFTRVEVLSLSLCLSPSLSLSLPRPSNPVVGRGIQEWGVVSRQPRGIFVPRSLVSGKKGGEERGGQPSKKGRRSRSVEKNMGLILKRVVARTHGRGKTR